MVLCGRNNMYLTNIISSILEIKLAYLAMLDSPVMRVLRAENKEEIT
jgi:hypothetical protein